MIGVNVLSGAKALSLGHMDAANCGHVSKEFKLSGPWASVGEMRIGKKNTL